MAQDSTPQYLREQAAGDSVDRGFYNIQDGQKGRDGGPYLDHVERQQAEIRRAQREDREPEDLNGPLPASVGTVQVVAALVPDNPYSNPSMAAAPGLETAIDDSTYEADHLASPIQVLPVDLRTEPADDTPDSGSPLPAASGTPTDSGFDGATVNVEKTADTTVTPTSDADESDEEGSFQ